MWQKVAGGLVMWLVLWHVTHPQSQNSDSSTHTGKIHTFFKFSTIYTFWHHLATEKRRVTLMTPELAWDSSHFKVVFSTTVIQWEVSVNPWIHCKEELLIANSAYLLYSSVSWSEQHTCFSPSSLLRALSAWFITINTCYSTLTSTAPSPPPCTSPPPAHMFQLCSTGM